jgi:hypothetical protein
VIVTQRILDGTGRLITTGLAATSGGRSVDGVDP